MMQISRIGISIAVLALVALTACDSGSDSDGTIAPDEFQTAELSLFGFEDGVDALGDATMEAPMAFPDDLAAAHPRGHGHHPGGILRGLDLTHEQKRLVMSAFFTSRHCMRDAIEAFREINQETIDAANARRAEIIEAWRGGEITGEQAVARLRELNEATRETIRNDPANEPVRDALCTCIEELFSAIESVLDEQQQAAWTTWRSENPGDCLTN